MPKKYNLSKKNKKIKRGKKSTMKNKRKTFGKKKSVRKIHKKRSRRRQKGGNFNPEQVKQLKDKLNEFGFTEEEKKEIINELHKISGFFGNAVDQIISQLEGIQYETDDLEEQRQNVREFVYNQEEQFGDDANTTEYEGDSQFSELNDEEV